MWLTPQDRVDVVQICLDERSGRVRAWLWSGIVRE